MKRDYDPTKSHNEGLEKLMLTRYLKVKRPDKYQPEVRKRELLIRLNVAPKGGSSR